MGGLNAEFTPIPVELVVCRLHCSIARNKSKSHRFNINSNTLRLRCGNNCANISIAFCETVCSNFTPGLSISNTGIGELDEFCVDDGGGGDMHGSVTFIP